MDTSTDNVPDSDPAPPEGDGPDIGSDVALDGASDVDGNASDVALTPEQARRRRRRRRGLLATILVVAVVAGAVLVAAVVRVPYYLLSPGGTYRTQNLITVQGAPTYPQVGSIEYVTVSVTSQRATALQWLWAKTDSSVTIAPADQIVPPNQTPSQNLQENFREMADSKTAASVVALEHLGYHVHASGTGAGVAALGKGTPASKVLHAGDTIVAVDGQPVHLAEDLVAIIHAHKPGDTVAITVDPAPTKTDKKPAPATETVTLATNPTDSSQAYLGVALETRDLKFPDLPVTISVSTPDVGGPSAGLAFTLGNHGRHDQGLADRRTQGGQHRDDGRGRQRRADRRDPSEGAGREGVGRGRVPGAQLRSGRGARSTPARSRSCRWTRSTRPSPPSPPWVAATRSCRRRPADAFLPSPIRRGQLTTIANVAANSPEGGSGMTPDDIGRKTFTMVRKGFDPIEVQGYLLAVATELREARSQALGLDRELQAARHEAERSRDLDPSQLTALLGEETARVLDAARMAADEMRAKAEQSSSLLLSETIASTDDLKAKAEESSTQLRTETEAAAAQLRAESEAEATRVRAEAAELLEQRRAEAESEVADIQARGAELAAQAEAEAAAEIERGRQEGREMVAEAQRVRERMLNDLARRRKAFRQQIERLQAGRDRLMSAYDVVRETLDVATEELTVALPQARLAAEAAALRAADEHEPSLEELEREASQLPEVDTPAPPARDQTDAAEVTSPTAADEPTTPEPDAPIDQAASAETPAEPDDDRPRAPSDTSVEGRHSSSVKVIRADEPAEAEAPQPDQPPPDAEAVTAEADPMDAPAAAAAVAASDEDPPEPPTEPGEVSSLFARIREETVVEEVVVVDEATGTVEVLETVETETVDIEIVEEVLVDEAELAELTAQADELAEAAAQSEPLDPDHELLARRDEALVEIERNLGRRIKRELSDEQNELLDTVRRQKGVPTAEAALPDQAAHLARYRTAALPSLVAAATAGGDLLADMGFELSPTSTKAGAKAGELAGELAADLVEPLRQRLDRCFEETAGDSDELAERLRACYREWKGQRVDELVSRLALAAANRGLVDRLPAGTPVHWVVDDGDTPSPDCDDNALAGDIPRGEPFPTGHATPPISDHCRCLVAPKRV